ncbi:ewing's tumor-associated antigen 1 [Eublepharis macularius]|uniref:Ewing's tumor-associated antigen 1 n=1 Tax=Eublepharis macularius TaxID=481883 RepID=A0AA97LM07_EUBMA|nr:ewing's tumor-associated antigen 1 [Eublepharis macularius]
MASKRRRAAAPEEKLRPKSPAKRSGRRKARDRGSPPGKTEEICSYKTPKRPSRACLPTFSSPANEADIQQEIFWDPHSPIAHKLGSGRKKQAAGRSTVEISEIVDRIAPQEEKPSCHEGSLLGMWIGDDAIPCTPGIAKGRPRTKVNNARGLHLKHKEEELMKLAKEFDKNLTEAIQEQDASCLNAVHLPSESKVSVEHQGNTQAGNQQFLGQRPQIGAALQFGVAKENAETTEHCERSSQKPIDLDAEIALNALFDCSPQKCSGRLSPNSSIGDFHDSQNAFLPEELVTEETAGIYGSVAIDADQRQGSVPASTCRVPIPAEKTKMVLEQTIPSTVASKTEPAVSSNVVSDEDWGADLLSDDSFVMQITQNPELISVPQNVSLGALPGGSCKTKERAPHSDKPNSAHCAFLKPSNDVSASLSLQKQIHEFGATRAVSQQSGFHLRNDAISSVSKSSQNNISGCNSVPVKAETQSVTEGFTRLKSASILGKKPSVSVRANLSQPLVGKSRRNMPTISSEPSAPFAKSKLNDQKELACLQAGPEKLISSFGDWNGPRISDEVLDSFCESDGLWGADCEDDDLLYRVCDDVERNTQSQDVAKENVKATLMVVSAAKLETDPGLPIPKQGLAHRPQPQKSHMGRKTFSLNAPLTATALLKSENSADPCVQRSCAPFKNVSIPGELFGSDLVPDKSLASGSGSVPLANTYLNTNNSNQCQNVTCKMGKLQNSSSNQASNEKSKYMFRKTSSSQAVTLDRSSITTSSLGGAPAALGESKNGPNILLHTAVQTNPKPTFKRHLSDSFAYSGTEQKSRKCSQEEIARKKQEALERRKYKMQALLKSTAPT